ncbi:unnamed protein product [Acanthoscelides obtectus]|uniref:Apical junction molecule ajm1 alpha/beta domain-containing protein n=1 Tax=Acanthoscelides obtectus TaxID=200917 RepID=A0A9P0JYU1_ACAOB|nr:unnamed protein product [Acanthoscelides obtectus]CAK1653980.1 Apical junction component 1 homolog [Acanthoscelides obtectus]
MESANTSPCPPKTSDSDARRRSDGSDACSEGSRRQSMTSSPVLRCRYSRCSRAVLATAQEAAAFKNCHNCSYTYCSRACRRAHWEKHRKTCLFSRIGSLCRQVIASAKEQKDTLMHLSKIARRGYLSQGVGAVKCFFPNPEAAESFLTHGLSHLGEITYVRWQDLLPSEMGPQLYSELVKMCKCYNPESKLILYVCVCVISETPAAGAVKWERQLVSRCAKMRLSKEEQSYESLETLILTSSPLIGDTFTVRELRTRCVDNLQGHLRIKGVSLKKQHPEIHRQLTAYVEDATVQLTTMTVFPKDSFTGKSFMCVIMLEVNQKSVKEVEGTRGSVRTIDVMRDVFGSV